MGACNAQDALNLADGWEQFSFITPGFLVQ
jgi:hypothetical protein